MDKAWLRTHSASVHDVALADEEIPVVPDDLGRLAEDENPLDVDELCGPNPEWPPTLTLPDGPI